LSRASKFLPNKVAMLYVFGHGLSNLELFIIHLTQPFSKNELNKVTRLIGSHYGPHIQSLFA
jgi:hypothetical protein